MSNTVSLQLITDAVVAEYIHEISERHRAPEPESTRPQDARSGGAPAVEHPGRLFV
jgi:hypothetical protein